MLDAVHLLPRSRSTPSLASRNADVFVVAAFSATTLGRRIGLIVPYNIGAVLTGAALAKIALVIAAAGRSQSFVSRSRFVALLLLGSSSEIVAGNLLNHRGSHACPFGASRARGCLLRLLGRIFRPGGLALFRDRRARSSGVCASGQWMPDERRQQPPSEEAHPAPHRDEPQRNAA